MNKKGATLSFEMLMWIPRLVFLIIVIMATQGIILAYIATNVNVGSIESHVLMQRLQFSPEGIVNHDSITGRVYTGVVDLEKLNSHNLEASLEAEKSELAARFVLISLQAENELARSYINRETYEDWQPIAIFVGSSDVAGTGRKFPHPETRYMYSVEPSKLETVVITPNG
ncbi:hypothetical protein J4470_01075 [Candidatus Woesearchaeota archaeon]|nr:hypothetical protein [Candidatus Woesearchaeota archaeon]